MRIGMILDVPTGFPTDIRVAKEARALCEAGFEVALLARKSRPDQPMTETTDFGLQIRRAKVVDPGPVRAALRSVKTLCRPWFHFAEWAGPIRDFIEDFRPDVLHAHDLTIVPTVLDVNEPFGLPVVADLHENMPATRTAYMRSWPFWHRMRFHLSREYPRWRWMERKALARCARVIVVVPEASVRLTEDYGLPADRIVVVSNTEDETTFNLDPPDEAILARYRDCWAALYIGGIGAHRGIDTAIAAAPLAARKIDRFRLVIVGIRGREKGQLLKLLRRYGAEDCVQLVEWVPFSEVNSHVAAARVGLVPHNDFEHTQTTVPHKLFQYMLMGKPVIVSDCAPLQRIVRDADAGLVFRAGDPASLAECLVRLHDDEAQLVERFSRNGRAAAIGPYAWRNDARRLLEIYQRLAETGPASTRPSRS